MYKITRCLQWPWSTVLFPLILDSVDVGKPSEKELNEKYGKWYSALVFFPFKIISLSLHAL